MYCNKRWRCLLLQYLPKCPDKPQHSIIFLYFLFFKKFKKKYYCNIAIPWYGYGVLQYRTCMVLIFHRVDYVLHVHVCSTGYTKQTHTCTSCVLQYMYRVLIHVLQYVFHGIQYCTRVLSRTY